LANIIKSENTWKLSGDVTIEHLHVLSAETKTFPSQLTIDLSGASDVDTATISMIFEWLRQAQTQACQLSFSGLPKNLKSLIDLYGVADLIPVTSH
jgi:phospholipid transport system transporter-binding protein